MNLKRRICYGVLKISRATARHVREEWTVVESPSIPTHFASTEVPLYVLNGSMSTKEKRPLAA